MSSTRPKPKMFFASSTEELDNARAFAELLQEDVFPIIWRDSSNTFPVGSSFLESLLAQTRDVEFAVFLLAPDDTVIRNGRETVRARDNVIFELGLFMSVLGRECTLAVVHKDAEYPTDLAGINHIQYEPNPNDLKASVATAANLIRQRVKQMQKSAHMLEKQNRQGAADTKTHSIVGDRTHVRSDLTDGFAQPAPTPNAGPKRLITNDKRRALRTLALWALGLVLLALVSYAWYLNTNEVMANFATAMTYVAPTPKRWKTVRIFANSTGSFSTSFDDDSLEADTVHIIIRDIPSGDSSLDPLKGDITQAITRWNKLYESKRIKELCIQKGSYYPYSYYATFDDEILISGLFVPNMTSSTQSDIQNAKVVRNRTKFGQAEIASYQKHFDCFASYIAHTIGSSANVSPSTCPHALAEDQLRSPSRCWRD